MLNSDVENWLILGESTSGKEEFLNPDVENKLIASSRKNEAEKIVKRVFDICAYKY